MEVVGGRPRCSIGPIVLLLLAACFGLLLGLVRNAQNAGDITSVLPLSSFGTLHNELTELKEIVEYQEAYIRSLRGMLGALSCKVQNVGPTGGFCLSVDDPDSTPGLNKIDQKYAQTLADLFQGGSVLDVGTGYGNYGRWFAENAPAVKWEGIDGAENIEEVTQGWVKFADFSQNLRLPKRDWVMSIEVGEHLPKQFEDVFVDNLSNLAKIGVVVTWARPGQLGFAHVNEKSFEDVREMFIARGMVSDEAAGQQLRDAADPALYWLRTNSQVFRWPR